MLGLYSLAVKHYERILKLAEENGVSLISLKKKILLYFDSIFGF